MKIRAHISPNLQIRKKEDKIGDIVITAVLLYSLSDLLVPELARCRAALDRRRIRALSDRCLRFGLLYAAAVSGLNW